MFFCVLMCFYNVYVLCYAALLQKEFPLVGGESNQRAPLHSHQVKGEHNKVP